MKNGFAIFCLLAVAATNLFSREDAFPKISGLYLGQKTPGLTPEIFAPGIVCSGMMERDVAITADGSEIYFGISFGNVVTIMWTRLWQGRWSEPEVAPFATDANYYHFEPALSADGKRIFFLSNRPGKGQEAKPGWAYEGIWAANRRSDGSWGEPYDPFPALNGEAKQFFPSLTREGTLYFTRVDRQAKKPAIYRSRPVNGEYTTSERLPDTINGNGTPYNAFIARDESYLIACVDARPCDANPGKANYFIFFRDKNDHWSDGIPFGPEVNMKGSTAMSPYVSPDGKHLFFAAQKTAERFLGMLMGRTRSWFQKMNDSCQNGNYDIYWVDAEIIEPLRLQALAASAPAMRKAGREPLTLTRIANSGVMPASGGTKIAIVTFVSSPDQERLVKAMIRSIRERGGGFKESAIYVVTADAENLPCKSLMQDGVEVLPLEMERTFLDHPLALKAFAAAQVEKKVKKSAGTLVWLDPGVLVLKPLEALALGDGFDAAVRPVTLANTIGIAPQAPPNDYWQPIYKETRLDYKKLPVLKTIADEQEIQPYYNCEVFSFDPRLGLAGEWARLLTRFLKDDDYQKSVCTTFLKKLFLHQAVLSAVISSRIKPDRIKALPLTCGYPFNQHDKLPAASKTSSLDDLEVVIFDDAWDRNPDWMKKIRIEEPLKQWLFDTYLDYLEIAPQIYRVEGSCNSYLVVTEEGSILIDPAGASVAQEFFKKILEKSPLQAILLTHAHPDHSDDIGQWLGQNRIPVIAQREFTRYFDYIGKLEGFFARRNAIWAGKQPAAAPVEQPKAQAKPTVYFSDEHELELGDLHFKMRHTPGETPDHTTIWIPELKAVFVGDNYYEYFINNSTFRGTMIRPVLGYIRALDNALSLDPEYFLMGHGSPLVSGKEVKNTAGNFRDALQYVYDETVKGINAGKDVYTLMREITLPEKYAIPQYFGKVEWTVRGIWQEYVGWFDENPASMYDVPFSDIYPDLAGLAGEEKLLARARKYLDQKEYVKALHLTEIALKADPMHISANKARLDALNGLKAGARNFIERIWLNHAIRQCEENLSRISTKEGQ